MREIGSEFWNVPTGKGNQIFPKSTQWFLSGRSALQAIIKDMKGAKTVAIPSWCCESMVKPFVDAGMDVRFYPVYPKEVLIQEEKEDCDVLFVMDYFGYTATRNMEHPCVIRDVTHSILSSTYTDADYYFGSLRKWCGVWTGGYAWTKDAHSLVMEDTGGRDYRWFREKAMDFKSLYINNVLTQGEQKETDKDFLTFYEQAEKQLELVGIAPAAERDVLLANTLDVQFIKSRRRANAKILMEAFKDYLLFPELGGMDCPMFVPILVPDGKRNELRSYLIENKIYCPIHWPVSGYHKLDEKTEFLYKNELSLVCDQRYTEEDMCREVETIKDRKSVV